jgi:hypothetical protein
MNAPAILPTDRPAVLICNGPSANGYKPPAGAFVVTLNGGFQKFSADAAFTTDDDGELKPAWDAWKGYKVAAVHNGWFHADERFECERLLAQSSGSGPCAVAWLASRGFKRCTVVGMDALYGNSRLSQSGHVNALRSLAPKFSDGLYFQNGKEIRIDDAFLANLPTPPPVAIPQSPMVATPIEMPNLEPAKDAKPCKLTQTLVEFDVSPKCNRACSFCAPGIPADRRKQKKSLTLAQVKTVIDELAALGYSQPDRCVCFCGHGEPLLAKELPAMVRYARERLPLCEVGVYSNTDRLTPDFLALLEAQDARLIADLYDKDSGPRLATMVADSGCAPGRVLIADHSAGKFKYSSRAGNVPNVESAPRPSEDCHSPAGKLFVTDDGNGGVASLLCCEDYGRATLQPGALRADAKVIAKRTGICAKCSLPGTAWQGWNAWGCYQPLDKSDYWPPATSARCGPDTNRLVILPVTNKWVDNAAIILDAIDRLSTVPGRTMVLWNGDGPCPEVLKGGDRIIRECEPLTMPHPRHPRMTIGWTAINRPIGEALAWGLGANYDWCIKLDTDVAIMRKGWDAAILTGGEGAEQRGFYLEERVCDWASQPLQGGGGIFEPDMYDAMRAGAMRWARGHLRAKWLKGGHVQGGCYAVSKAALKRLEFSGVGIVPDKSEENIGEDILFSLRCRVAGIKQTHTPAVVSHYFPVGNYHLTVARYYRDACKASVIHPIKSTDDLRTLCAEAK